MDITVTYNLDEEDNLNNLATALNSSTRRRILRLIAQNSYSVIGIAELLNLSVSNVTFHLKLLKEAGLVRIQPNSNKKGNEKIVSQGIAAATLVFHSDANYTTQESVETIPIGSYTACDVKAPCGLVNSDGLIFMHDNPNVFLSPSRFTAVMVAFSKGYVEYSIPAFEYKNKYIESFTFSLELCSECPNYNNSWKSDITFWLNGKELCTYRSMGDYGDRRGKYTLPHWPVNSTQYGMLKKIRIDREGVYLDEQRISDMTLNDFDLAGHDIVTLRIGIKENARYAGGINLFGKNFGDTDQDIIVQVSYRDE